MFLIITGFMLKPISSACCPTTKWYYKIYNTRNFRWPGIAFKVTSLCKPVESSLLIHTSCLISEKAMVTHSSTLAWKIPWMEEPGRLQSMGSQRVGLDWETSLSLSTFMHWRRKWQRIPVFLPGESQGWGSLVSCHLWGLTESDTTEAT